MNFTLVINIGYSIVRLDINKSLLQSLILQWNTHWSLWISIHKYHYRISFGYLFLNDISLEEWYIDINFGYFFFKSLLV